MKTNQNVFPLGVDSKEVATSPKNDVLSHVFAERKKDVEMMQPTFALLSDNLIWINWGLQEGYSKLSNMLYDKFNALPIQYNPKDVVLQIDELIESHSQIIHELESSTVKDKSSNIQNKTPWSIGFMIRSHIHFQQYLKNRKTAFV